MDIPSKLVSLVISLLVLCGVGWYANGKLEDYYTEDLKTEVNAAAAKKDAALASREAANTKRENEALHAKNKKLQNNLAAAHGAAESRGGLLDTASAIQQRTQNSASACAQYSAALVGVLAATTAVAGRIAKEADGHAADSYECHSAWPQ